MRPVQQNSFCLLHVIQWQTYVTSSQTPLACIYELLYTAQTQSFILTLSKQLTKIITTFCKSHKLIKASKYNQLEMWANAQRDGRPAKYRWRPLFNAAVRLTPTTRVPCSNAAKTWNLLTLPGCPKLTKQSQPLVGRSSPYCGDM